MEIDHDECLAKILSEDKHDGIFFSPPLFLQRYKFVADTLAQYDVASVLDIGCSECMIMRFLPDVKSLKRVALLDQDEDLLRQNNLRIKPALHRFIEKRKNPLKVQLYHGNATLLDKRMLGFDAVSMIEFIEHLHKKDLQDVLHAVFKGINPQFVIVTTPNFEFNALFQTNGNNGMKFRHIDHKFEWTRSQFQEWGAYMCSAYGYRVKYCGVGLPPLGKEYVGCCTQVAVFERTNGCQSTAPRPPVFDNLYTLIDQCDYPHQEENQCFRYKLKIEVEYYLRSKLRRDTYIDFKRENVAVPLAELFQYKPIEKLCERNINILREFIACEKYQLTPDTEAVIIAVEEYSPDLIEEDDTFEDDVDSLYQYVQEKFAHSFYIDVGQQEDYVHEEYWG